MHKACISIPGPSLNECLEQIGTNQFVELRYDLYDFDSVELDELYKTNRMILATCRPDKLGLGKQKQTLSHAIKNGAQFIDIEIDNEPEQIDYLINLAREYHTKVILSYHNFKETPAYPFLISVIENAQSGGADYVKLACKVNSEKDNSKLLALYKDFDNLISFGMGEIGKISRIASVFLGAPFTYVASKKEYITADGQFTFEEFEQIINAIN